MIFSGNRIFHFKKFAKLRILNFANLEFSILRIHAFPIVSSSTDLQCFAEGVNVLQGRLSFVLGQKIRKNFLLILPEPILQ